VFLVAPAPVFVVVPAPVRRSGAAVASLVFGIVGGLIGWCLFGIPSAVAIITGHVGLIRTRGGRRSGRQLAVAGLVLGYGLLLPTIAVTLYLAWSAISAVFGTLFAIGTAAH
jgi:hypothetical protein